MSADKQNHSLLLGTLTLTASGLAARFAGLFYRIYLSRKITAEAMGLYQLVYPLYSICFSLCCASFQTALSRFVAAEYPKPGGGHSLRYLACGLSLSLSLAFPASMLLFLSAPWIASHILGDPRCCPLLKIMAWSVPLSAIHSCICGYYYGRSRASIPASAQIMEQLVRISTVMIVIFRAKQTGKEITAFYAALGHFAGEMGALLTSSFFFLAELRRRNAFKTGCTATPSGSLKRFRRARPGIFHSLLLLTLPLMANRISLSLLQSAETILIPSRLRLFGLSASDALSLYGVFTGMAFPFVLFPTALTGSLSVMLLPHIARAQSEQAYDSISASASVSIRCSLILGILFSGLFLHYGTAIGTTLFRNETAGILLKILAWLCPFLYVSGTMASILNGLGYTKITFLHNLAGLALRFACVLLIVPFLGIRGYLYGLLAGELLLTVCHLRFLCRKGLLFSFSFFQEIFRPVFCVLISSGIIKGAETLSFFSALPPLGSLIVSGCLFVFCYGMLLWLLKPATLL